MGKKKNKKSKKNGENDKIKRSRESYEEEIAQKIKIIADQR